MNEIRFVHCADIHLDAPFSSMVASGDKTSLRRYDLREVFKNIVEITQNRKASLLLISGDLYEHNYVKKSTMEFINSLFKQIDNTHIFIAPGNHDPNTLNSYYASFKWNKNVHIFTRENPSIFVEELGVCVHGTCFNSFIEDKPLLPYIKTSATYGTNILLAHGTVEMQFDNCQYNPMSVDELASLGMDYIALGHFHNRFEITEKRIFNPGSPEPLGFDEPGEHGIYFGCIAHDGVSSKLITHEFIKMNKKTYVTLDIPLNGCCSDEEAAEVILQASSSMDNTEHSLLSINLKGRVSKDLTLNTAYIKQILESNFFYIKLQDHTSKDIDLDEIVKDSGIKGLFAKKLLNRINSAGDEKTRQMLLDALCYGLEALDKGKVDIIDV